MKKPILITLVVMLIIVGSIAFINAGTVNEKDRSVEPYGYDYGYGYDYDYDYGYDYDYNYGVNADYEYDAYQSYDSYSEFKPAAEKPTNKSLESKSTTKKPAFDKSTIKKPIFNGNKQLDKAGDKTITKPTSKPINNEASQKPVASKVAPAENTSVK